MMYGEHDGTVILTITRDDWEGLLIALGYAMGATRDPEMRRLWIGLVNRLNEGNPKFTPFDLEAL